MTVCSRDADPLPVLGWKEEADLPEWDVVGLRVKLDTGARTSALHVRDVHQVGTHPHDNGELPVLAFAIPLSRRYPDRLVEATAPVVAYKSVRDTGAKAELRPVIRTRIVCGPIDALIDVTLTDRTGMIFRMLLGRGALAGRVTVDPARSYTTRTTRAASRRRPRPVP